MSLPKKETESFSKPGTIIDTQRRLSKITT